MSESQLHGLVSTVSERSSSKTPKGMHGGSCSGSVADDPGSQIAAGAVGTGIPRGPGRANVAGHSTSVAAMQKDHSTSPLTVSRLTALLVVIALLAASCGDDDTTESADVTDQSTTSSVQSDTGLPEDDPDAEVDRAARVEAWLAGTNSHPPASAPEIDPDKNVWVFSCFELVESCSRPAAAAVEAAESLGWTVTLFDVQGLPERVSEGVRNAIADGADAIIGGATDCRLAPAAFDDARSAGVLVVTYYAFDCEEDPNVDDEDKFDGSVIYGDGSIETYTDFNHQIAGAKTDWVVEQTGGSAKIITVDQTEVTISQILIDGIEAGLEGCDDCEIVDVVEVTTADVAGFELESKLAASLLEHPEANAVIFGIDFHASLGGSQAIDASGRDLVVIGGEGYATAMSQMADGLGLDAIGGISGAWGGYAAVDALARLFAGEEIEPSGIGWQIVEAADAQSGDFEPEIDFRSDYREIWGVEG